MRVRVVRMTVLLAVTGVFTVVAVPLWAAPGVDATPLTLEADAVGLGDLLEQIGRRAGVGVIIRGGEHMQVTLSLAEIPFSQCMDLLAELFSLVITWHEGALLVRPVEEALRDAEVHLGRGRSDAVTELVAVGHGARFMYGPVSLRERVAGEVGRLIDAQTRQVLSSAEPDPVKATTLASLEMQDPQLRAPLGAAALRSFLRKGQVEEALRVWNTVLQGHTGIEAVTAWGDLLLALHYGGRREAAPFWHHTFSQFNVAMLLQEGWREGQYTDALHFARLNVQYAATSGRVADAGAIQAAIDACLNSPRVIKITCVVDSKARTDRRWEEKVRARVAACSHVFDEAFSIQFEIAEIIQWNPPSDSNFGRQYDALRSALGRRRPELAIGFILEVFDVHPSEVRVPVQHLWTGYGSPHMGGLMLTRDFAFEHVTDLAATEWTFSAGTVAETLVHEMGHMFGALHLDDDRSVMRPSPTGEPRFTFDAVNARVIRQQKWKDFSRGVASLDEPELLALANGYQELSRLSSRPNGAAEEEARVHLALGKLYRQRGNPPRARDHLRETLAIGVPSDIVAEARVLLQEIVSRSG